MREESELLSEQGGVTAVKDKRPQQRPKKEAFVNRLRRLLVLLFVVIALIFAALAAAGQLRPLFDKALASLMQTEETLGVDGVTDQAQQAEPKLALYGPENAVQQPPERAVEEAVVRVVEKTVVPSLEKTLEAPLSAHNVLVAPSPIASTDAAVVVDQLSQTAPVTVAVVAPAVSSAVISGLKKQAAEQSIAPLAAAKTVSTELAVDAHAMLADAQIKRLKGINTQLKAELVRLQQLEQQLKSKLQYEQQHALQTNMQLQLQWLVAPSAKLSQIVRLWKAISLRPELNQQQRSEANQMYALAIRSQQQVHQWQQRMIKWAAVLVVPTAPELLPKPEHPWLAWVVGQFHLHKAVSMGRSQLSTVHNRLLDMARQLSFESWPDRKKWQTLYSDVISEAQHVERTTALPKQALPVNMDALQESLSRLHRTAMRWKQQSEEGI
ncbi:MAG: hypothetical protein Q9M31_09260 [Mariprofundus sp.]|nr:hypothetical protein [Mariprofundus sp.]